MRRATFRRRSKGGPPKLNATGLRIVIALPVTSVSAVGAGPSEGKTRICRGTISTREGEDHLE